MISKFLSKINKEDLNNVEKVEQSNVDEKIEKFESIIKVLVDEIKDVLALHDKLNNKVKNIEENIKKIKAQIEQLNSDFNNEKQKKQQFDERIKSIENNMHKFVSLYELITNQYNPFIKQENENNYNKNIENRETKNSEIKENIKKDISVNGNKIVIEDSLTGNTHEINVNENNKFANVEIPKGNKLASDLAKRESLYIKYSEDKFDELKDFLKDLNVKEDEIKNLLKEVKVYENPEEPEKIKELAKEINENKKDYDEVKKEAFEVLKDYPKLANEIKNAKNLDELKHILLRETINHYINKEQKELQKKIEN